MKKKMFSGFLAAALAMSMSVTAFASSEVTDFTNGVNVDGDGTVLAVSDVFDVIVPTNVNYAINPAELNGKPQVMSGSFGVINHGSTAVKVDIAASVADSATVTISDSDTISSINNATDVSAVVEDALLYLAVAPVAAGKTVTAQTATDADSYSEVGFDVVADVAANASVAIPASGSKASVSFKLPAASYSATISGSAATANGGFDTSGVTAVQSYTGDFTDDPVAAFTLIGSVNKYADWTAVTLPQVTLTFSFSKLNELAYDALDVNPATVNMIQVVDFTYAGSGILTWASDKVASIDSIVATNKYGTFDALDGSTGFYEASVTDMDAKTITLDNQYLGYYDDMITAAITYTETSGLQNTVIITFNQTFVSPGFSYAANTISWTSDEIASIDSILMTNNLGTYDALDGTTGYYAASIVDTASKTVALNSTYVSFYSGSVTATIKYTTTSGSQFTATLVCTF